MASNINESLLRTSLCRHTTECLVLGFLCIWILVLNLLLPFPDSNDFQELSRICLLMDSSVNYCVNNNWGFAHPLICWAGSQITGNLLIAQRVANAFFAIILFCSLFGLLKRKGNYSSQKMVVLGGILLTSPWVVDILLSVHLDIASIALVALAMYLASCAKTAPGLIMAGLIAGSSYWFRFHFLSFALFFPFIAIILNDIKITSIKKILIAGTGAAIAIAVPHLLCELVYGVFSISNQKFVLAQALGVADWSTQFAQKIDTLQITSMLQEFNAPLFFAKYAFHFVKSGIFPLLVIFAASTYLYFREPIASNPIKSKFHIALWLVLYASFAVIPFTFLRGFTYRLEAAFVVLAFPIVMHSFAYLNRRIMQ